MYRRVHGLLLCLPSLLGGGGFERYYILSQPSRSACSRTHGHIRASVPSDK
ncbi:hypothetical protein PR002_g30271 [Phytophthora rubi]|uniref:Uncharacterized protein n=1 Tax=Phytophthora rubi TaxID=129364 RepID=A0A6A3GTI5_9STRA|nr:hypothetical protein PR002_g30271 [Phytophthora rubi]